MKNINRKKIIFMTEDAVVRLSTTPLSMNVIRKDINERRI